MSTPVSLPVSVPAAAVLSPTDRVAREPLPSWAGWLGRKLAAARAADLPARNLAGEVGAIGNNAALIVAHLGRSGTAATLCETQIEWHARRARECGDPGVNAYAVQPWVNLGRLEVLRGEWAPAVARFGGLTAYARAGVLDAGCARIGERAWDAVAHTREEFEGTLETVRVLDTCRALLLNRRWNEVLEFSAAQGGTRPSLQRVGDEAAVVALSRRGDLEGALELARSAEKLTAGWPRAVFRLRRGEVLLAMGDTAGAARLFEPMAGVVLQLSPEVRNGLNTQYVLNRLSCAALEAGLDDRAGAVGRVLLEGARAAKDEVFEIEALRLLARLPGDGERERWQDALARAERVTCYAKYRSVPHEPQPEIELLIHELLDLFAY